MDFLVKMILTAGLLIQSNVESAPRQRRLTEAEISPNIYYYNNIEGQPGTYAFNYDISDDLTGNNQFRNEERYPNGTVTGAYGYVDAFGVPQRYRYIADQAGYRVYREEPYKPFYGHQNNLKPSDKIAVEPTESSITWTRPKRPTKKNKNNEQSQIGFQKHNYGNRRYNLIGPPSVYVPYY